MDLDEMLAVVGGAAGGFSSYRHDKDTRDQREATLAMRENDLRLREMLEQIKEEGRNARAAAGETGKTTRTGMQQTGATTRTEMTVAGANSRNERTNETTRRGQDMADERYWSGENPLQWDRDFLTSRRDTQASSDRRRGQDMTSSTTRRGQDMRDTEYWDASSRQWDQGQQRIDDAESNHAVDYAMGAYRNELARRRAMRGGPISIFAAPGSTTTVGGGQPGAAPVGPGLPQGGGDTSIPTFKDWLDQTDDPEVFPSVKRMFGASSATSPSAPPAGQTPPASMGAPPPRGPKAAAPVTPKGAPPASGASPLEQQATALLDKIRRQEAETGQPAADLRAQLARLREQARGK